MASSIADFVDMDDNTYTSLLEQIRTNREFPYIATSLAKLLSREDDFVRSSLSGAMVKLPLQKKDSSNLDAQIILGIYYMSSGEYEEAQRCFFEARSTARDKELAFALRTVGSNILYASELYKAAVNAVKSSKSVRQ